MRCIFFKVAVYLLIVRKWNNSSRLDLFLDWSFEFIIIRFITRSICKAFDSCDYIGTPGLFSR